MQPAALPLVAPLTDRLLRVHGPDARAWLQGLVSHDVLALPEGQSRYALILDEKGRVVADPTVVAEGAESLLLVLPADRLERVYEHLTRRLVTEEVEVEPLPHRGVTVQGGAEAQLPPAERRIAHDRSGLGGWDLFAPEGPAYDALLRWCDGRDHSDAVEDARIRAGIPRLGVDIEATTLPAEAGLHDALHFGKGCYLGQEVVARLAHRGQTTKELRRFTSAPGSVAAGSRLWAADDDGQLRDVGVVTSAARDGEHTVGLCMVKRRYFGAGQVLQALPEALACTLSAERVRGHVALSPENDPGFRGNKVHRALVS